MQSKLNKILASFLIASTVVTFIPPPADAAPAAFIAESQIEWQSTSDPIYTDIQTINNATGEKIYKEDSFGEPLEDGAASGDMVTPLFKVITEASNTANKLDLKKLENALRASRLYVKFADNKTVTEDYTSTDATSAKGKILLGSQVLNQDNRNAYKWNDLKYEPLGIDQSDWPKAANIVQLIYTTKTKENEVKFVLRTFVYAQDASWIDEVKPSEGAKEIFVKDFDLDALMSRIKSSKESVDSYPIIKYFMESYSKAHQDLVDENKKKQKEVWDKYKTEGSLESYTYKSDLDSLNDYIVSEGSKSLPTLPAILYAGGTATNFSEQLTWYIYTEAVRKSAIFTTDLSGVGTATKITETTKSSALDWNVSGRKVLDKVEAVTAANEVSEKYDLRSTDFTSVGLDSNAMLFRDLMAYRYGIISGAEEQGVGSPGTDLRKPSSRLDQLLATTDQLIGKTINPRLYDQRDSTTIFGFPVEIKGYMNALASTQMLEYWAKDLSYSGIDPNAGDKNQALEAYITENAGKEANAWSPLEDSQVVRHVKAYRQIKEGLDYIGVKPWTTELEYIYNLYDKIKDIAISEEFDDYNSDSDTEPLKRFFSFSEKTLSKDYMTGVALSATYIPMQTNLYDPTSVRVLKNEDWLRDFHVRYGFYRKALMIDTNVNAAVDGYVTGSRDTTRVALLSDLLQYKKDIVLYVDDNFYNVTEVAEMTDKAYERLSNTEQSGYDEQSFKGQFDNLFNNSIEHILKTGPRVKYDGSTIDDVKQYGDEDKVFSWTQFKEKMFTDGIIFDSGDGPNATTGNEIKEGMDQTEYSVKQPYAILSGIYRHKALANYLNTLAPKPKPVFVSSPTLYNVQNVSAYEFNSIYNYYMLRNLEASMGIDYKTTLDLDNPIYVDIYGNIVTESGLVVIPAASNATLYPQDSYSPYNLGFMDLYSNGDNIPINGKITEGSNIEKYLLDFEADKNGEKLLQKNYEFNGVLVNPQKPSVSNRNLLEVLYDNQVALLNKQGYDYGQRTWLITEVLRGAPVEEINKVQEGIVGKRDVSKYGLYMSWKLDEIANMLLPTTNGNSVISMPNLAFMDGIEYVILFAFKLMLLLFVAYIMYRIYIDAVGGKLGLKTFGNVIWTITIFVLSIAAIPNVISLSYNEPNKIFLQNEIKYINLLNYEKSLEGREISAMGVSEPQSQTKLYLKLDSINVPWYKVLQDVMFAPVGATLQDLYDEELQKNMLYGFSDVEVVNNGVYMSVDDIFKSSSVVYNNTQNFLYQNVNTSLTASYFIPYYYMMDNLLASITLYNKENELINITTKIQSDGSVKTMGMVGDYLLSEYFLTEANDPLGLYDIYNISTNEKTSFVDIEGDGVSTTEQSMWYVPGEYKAEDISSRIDQLYSHMRAYVVQNRDMIGRVTDETFIKTMMLDLSMEYNQLFRIPAAKGIEVFSIDSRDLIRLSLTDKNTAVVNASNSFGKFVYEQSGGLGVIMTAVLIGVYFIVSIIKPALVIFLIIILVYNVLLKRMIQMEKGKVIEGLLYVLAIMAIVNASYAIVLKLSMLLPELGLGVLVSIIAQCIIQAIYLVLVGIVVSAIFKDVKNFGYNVFHSWTQGVVGAITGAAANIGNKAAYTQEQQEYMDTARSNNANGDKSAKDLRAEMEARDKKRDEAQEDDAFMDQVFRRENKPDSSS